MQLGVLASCRAAADIPHCCPCCLVCLSQWSPAAGASSLMASIPAASVCLTCARAWRWCRRQAVHLLIGYLLCLRAASGCWERAPAAGVAGKDGLGRRLQHVAQRQSPTWLSGAWHGGAACLAADQPPQRSVTLAIPIGLINKCFKQHCFRRTLSYSAAQCGQTWTLLETPAAMRPFGRRLPRFVWAGRASLWRCSCIRLTCLRRATAAPAW